MTKQQHNCLTHLNRVLIFALTTGGLLSDGLQGADLLGAIALLVWLWLPLCILAEGRLLQWFTSKHSPIRSGRGASSV